MKYLNHRLSAAMWSRVLLLWLTLSVGALVVGGIAFGLGRFIQDNIRNELTAQQISFSAADKLTDEERDEYEALINAADFISILKMKARRQLLSTE